jgi:hypothetical protein
MRASWPAKGRFASTSRVLNYIVGALSTSLVIIPQTRRGECNATLVALHSLDILLWLIVYKYLHSCLIKGRMWLWMKASLHPQHIHTIHPIILGFWPVNIVHLRHINLNTPYTFFHSEISIIHRDNPKTHQSTP